MITDACDPVSGPSHTPISVDDGDVCTNDACDPVSGPSHTPISVDDGNLCTLDTCHPVTGPSHTPIDPSDGNACTTDACNPTARVSHAPITCNDAWMCTDDSCDPAVGCVHEFDETNAFSCSGDPKTIGFYKRLCAGPHPEDQLTPWDAECVHDSDTFPWVRTVADICSVLYADPPNDKCEQGEAQFIAALLNRCRARIDDAMGMKRALLPLEAARQQRRQQEQGRGDCGRGKSAPAHPMHGSGLPAQSGSFGASVNGD